MVSLQEHMEQRLDALNARVDREISLLRQTLQEHFAAHVREHDLARRVIDQERVEIEKRLGEERTFLMHHNDLMQRAVDKAEATINERLEGMNEFRQALSEQSATLVRRDLLDTFVNALNGRIDERMAAVSSAGAERTRTTNVRIDGLETTITRRIDELREVVDLQGKKWANLEGRMYAISGLMALVIFIVTIVGFVMRAVGG